jgi:hypothetical protein
LKPKHLVAIREEPPAHVSGLGGREINTDFLGITKAEMKSCEMCSEDFFATNHIDEICNKCAARIVVTAQTTKERQ